jgi:hypothetical protein
MKSKGRSAWLITWEGREAADNGRCKIVAVLPPQFGETGITDMLPVLWCSESNLTLEEKIGFGIRKGRDPLLRTAYQDINPEFWYGVYPKEYLCARKVKNLHCEESTRDDFEATLYWTELAKFIPNPEIGPDDPLPDNPSDRLKEVRGAKEVSYLYSIRPRIEERQSRRAVQESFPGQGRCP